MPVVIEMSAQPDELVYLPVDPMRTLSKKFEKMSELKLMHDKCLKFQNKIWVTEYQRNKKNIVSAVVYTTMACFPEGVTHKTNMAPRIRSLMVYMNQYQLLPFERASEFF